MVNAIHANSWPGDGDVDTLLNFSGGIDSTYCVWEYLKQNPQSRLLVHHINLVNREGRVSHEKKAVTGILRKLVKSYGFSNYEYLETGFDYGNIKHVIKDIEIVGFFTGLILRGKKYQNVNKVILPSNKQDAESPGFEVRDKSRKDVAKLIARRDIEYVYPIRQYTKEELVQRLPSDLLELTWYCRIPKVDGKPCGKCTPCKHVSRSKT